jgi:DNA transformation protein and related proteins
MINNPENIMTLTITDVVNALSPFGDITARHMFGGYGIYKDGIIIALMDEEEVYFKSTPTSESFYQSFDSYPFVYEGQRRPVKMSYWNVPKTVFDDSTLLEQWIDIAYRSALTAQKTKKPPKRRPLL